MIRAPAGDIYTVAGGGDALGDGGPATKASMDWTASVALDPAGNLVIADMTDERIRVVAQSTGKFYGQAMTAGDIYTVAGDGAGGFSGDGGPATSATVTLGEPSGLAVDPATGSLVIDDAGNNRIRVVSSAT